MTSMQKEVNKGFGIEVDCFLTKWILKNVYKVSGQKMMWKSTFDEIRTLNPEKETGIPYKMDFITEARKGQMLGQLSIYIDKKNDMKVTLKEEYLVSIGEIKSMEEEFIFQAAKMGKKLKPEKLSVFSRSVLRAIVRVDFPRTNEKLRKFLRNPEKNIRAYLLNLKKMGYIQKLSYSWELTPLGKLFVDQFLTIRPKKEPKTDVLKPTEFIEDRDPFDKSV